MRQPDGVPPNSGPLKVLLFRPEIGAESPLWTPEGVMVGFTHLPLAPSLQERLTHWAGRSEDPYADHDRAELDREGRAVFAEVTEALDGSPFRAIWDYD